MNRARASISQSSSAVGRAAQITPFYRPKNLVHVHEREALHESGPTRLTFIFSCFFFVFFRASVTFFLFFFVYFFVRASATLFIFLELVPHVSEGPRGNQAPSLSGKRPIKFPKSES